MSDGTRIGPRPQLFSYFVDKKVWKLTKGNKSDFKERSFGPDTILLQGHAVTVTFKVATQVLRATRRLNGDHFCEIVLKSDFK